MNFTTGQLNEKTVPELRAMCTNMGISGMSKQRKDYVIEKLMHAQTLAARRAKKAEAKRSIHHVESVATGDSKTVNALEANLSSIMTKPSARSGDKCTTTIRVSAGASSGTFPVIGKTVGAVSAFLREVLNVDSLAQGVVNGKAVENDYVLVANDSLEYIKTAGKKG